MTNALSMEQINAAHRALDLEYYFVGHDAVEDGKRILNARLSQYFRTESEARTALPAYLDEHPDVGVCGGTLFFNPNRREDAACRARLVKTMFGMEVRHED